MGNAEVILLIAAGYAALGAVLGAAFVIRGVGRVDHAAVGASWGFRLLIWPGAAALWPVVIAKWFRAARQAKPSARSKHTSVGAEA